MPKGSMHIVLPVLDKKMVEYQRCQHTPQISRNKKLRLGVSLPYSTMKDKSYQTVLATSTSCRSNGASLKRISSPLSKYSAIHIWSQSIRHPQNTTIAHVANLKIAIWDRIFKTLAETTLARIGVFPVLLDNIQQALRPLRPG
jgi:hypothetical protein